MAARDMEAATAQSGTQCGADELKNLLAHITDQIVDADRRHTEVMRQMHDRLAQLGQEARSVRAQAPEQFDDAFDRIEDGMANLAERVAEAGGARKEVPAPAPARAATASAPAPMALRSAGDAPARIEPARPGMDHFGVHDASRPGDAAYPWDEDAAEALMQMHESEGTGYVRRTPDPEFVKPAAVAERAPVIPAAPIAPPIVAPVAPATGSMQGQNDVDKLWLEEQISVLARRLENSIADLRPDNSVQALGERFNEFEERLAAAFDGVASRADVESISLIEAHIGELAGHLDNVQAQLARLDTIEGQLQAVMGQLSDERLSQVRPAASSLQAASPAELQRVAMNAAEQVANRMQSLVSHMPGTDSGTPEFHAILDRFMEDRRLGEEQMVTTLDTMQQALIRVLDRMDVIEMAQYRDPAPVSHMAPAYAPELPRYAAPVAPAHAEDHVPAYVAPAATPYVVRAEPPFDAPSRAAPAAPVEAPVDISGMSPVDRIRHDFKADAQRAKQKAAAEASEAAAVKIDSPAKSAARKAGAASKAAGAYSAGTGSLFGGKRKLLIGALGDRRPDHGRHAYAAQSQGPGQAVVPHRTVGQAGGQGSQGRRYGDRTGGYCACSSGAA